MFYLMKCGFRNTFFSFIMVWDYHKDDMLVKDILLFEPFKFKQHTKERGNAWKMVADNLNEMDPEKFKVERHSRKICLQI